MTGYCTPAQEVYSSIACLALKTLHTFTPATSGATSGSSTLPFTGVDLLFVVLAGLFLIVLGVSLRRITRDGDA